MSLHRLVVFAVCSAWALGLGAGLLALCRYENAPGAAATPRPRWPQDTSLERGADRSTLVMFAHPHCPCTRATLGQLARALARTTKPAKVYVAFYAPHQMPQGWEQTDLWRNAAAIPGVKVVADPDGAESARFAATTSGQVLLYDRDGSLLFSGGITPSRGHEGDNVGTDAVVSLLNTGSALRRDTFVFGCGLRSDNAGTAASAVTSATALTAGGEACHK